ncbi:MAG: HD-GYP domain-containing protein [Solirubrobacteraceae bacterium]
MAVTTEPGPAELPLEGMRSHLALVANRDLYDPDHIDSIRALSGRLGERLGLAVAEIEHVEWVAQLRDVGKAMVPIAILRKLEPLDDAEWALLQRYPEHGAVLVGATPGWEHLAAPVRAGNERWDGAGYPDGLSGEAIPQASRITYVAQAYLAMLADRPYRVALTPAQAIVELSGGAGSQFCPATVTALVDVLLTDGSAPQPVPAPEIAAIPPVVPAPAVRASIAAPPREPGRTWRSRWAATTGALAGAIAGLALVLPLPDAATRCPPAGEGRAICLVKDIGAPALTIVAVCAAVGVLVLGFLLVRLPALLARRRAGGVMRPGVPAFATDPRLTAANWGVVYDDDDTALRVVGRRRWRREDSL